MKFSKAVAAPLMAAALSVAGGAHAATEQVVNGGFSSVSGGPPCLIGLCDTAASWTDNSITFSSGVANFNNGDDWLSQTFTTLFAAGTTFAGSFFYDKTNVNGSNGDNLTYRLESSATQNFSGPITLLGSATVKNGQADATLNFGSFTLANAGYVRIYFDSLSTRSFAVDNVSVLATAPVPEPGTYALFLAGLSAIGFIARRRRPQR